MSKELIRHLEFNLKKELESIDFYLKNVGKSNYRKNRKKIDILISGSFKHAQSIALEIARLKSGSSITSAFKDKALREEAGLQEIYHYQIGKVKDPKVKKLLKAIVKEEESHERIVRSL